MGPKKPLDCEMWIVNLEQMPHKECQQKHVVDNCKGSNKLDEWKNMPI